MKAQKIKWLFTTVLLLIALLVAGCGSNNDETASGGNNGETNTNNGETNADNEAAEEDFPETEISFLVDNQTVTDGIDAVAAEVQERYNITLNTEIRPGGTEGDNIVKTRLATGEMTDMMWYNSGSLFKES